MIYLPSIIPFRKTASDYSIQDIDTRVIFETDINERVRSGGTATYKLINMSIEMSNLEFNTFKGWFEANNINSFYAPFPDIDYPNIDPNKYYCFRFNDTALTYTKLHRYGYKVSFVLRWEYLVPAR